VTEPGLDTNENEYKIGKAAFIKIKPALLLNYYSILSDTALPPCQVKLQVTSSTSIANINKIRQGVLDRSIPSAIANSGATSNVSTKKDKEKQAYIPTGKSSSKISNFPMEQEHQQATCASSIRTSINQQETST
jgi:hypothetical protein